MATDQEPPLSEDVLEGGAAIARYLWGRRGDPRRAERLARAGEIPAFYLAGRLHARKSDITKMIDERVAATRARSDS